MDYKDLNDYEILYMIKENDENANNLIYSKYEPLIKKIARKYYDFASNRGAEYEDLEQEGYLGLNNAIKSFDENCNVLFYTYANLCIERQINLYCRNISTKKNEVLNYSLSDDFSFFDIEDDDSFNNPQRVSDYNFFVDSFISFKNSFDFKYSTIFELRYNGFSYKEIAELLDISESTVDGRLSKIRKNLHKFCKKQLS